MPSPDQLALIAGLEQIGLSRSEIAERAGLSRQTLYRLVNGDGRAPQFETFEKLEKLSRRVGMQPTFP